MHNQAQKMLELYKSNMSLSAIGKCFDVSQQTVKRRLVSLGVPIRGQTSNQRGSNNPSWKGGKRAYISRTAQRVCIESSKDLKQCQNCEKYFDINLNIHHIDHDRSNNNIENLKILCVKCHNSGWSGAEHMRKQGDLGRFI